MTAGSHSNDDAESSNPLRLCIIRVALLHRILMSIRTTEEHDLKMHISRSAHQDFIELEFGQPAAEHLSPALSRVYKAVGLHCPAVMHSAAHLNASTY